MSALQLQWDLSQSVGSTLALTQGIIRAATTDNVQPLALLACERFGATLAICQATCRNIEFEVIKVQTPSKRVLKFLGATIGFSGDDSTSQLVRSQAGVQFIGLVAALVPSLSLYEAAAALAMMLKDSAFDGTFLPPVSHLRDLLGSLEHRCARLGFSDQVVGWQRLLDKTSGKSAREYPALAGIEVPNIYCVAKLVDAFRQLSRIGDVSSITVRILRGTQILSGGCCQHLPLYLNPNGTLTEEVRVQLRRHLHHCFPAVVHDVSPLILLIYRCCMAGCIHKMVHRHATFHILGRWKSSARRFYQQNCAYNL